MSLKNTRQQQHSLLTETCSNDSVYAKKTRRTSVSPSALTMAEATEISTSEGKGVDMNIYNLHGNDNSLNMDLEDVAMGWAANLTPKSYFMEEGIYLGPRDKENHYVESLTFELSRADPNSGLGIELLEIAGGRGDDVGITICSGLVEGGNSESCGILPGDSIVSLSVVGTNAIEDAIPTECLDYDGTVDAILGLPSDWDTLIIGVKRLRRRPRMKVTLQFPPHEETPDQVLELFAGENLRRAMLARGVKLNDALSRRFDNGGTGDCGSEGTCATCVVNIQNGSDFLNPIGVQEAQILKKNPRWRFACKAVVGHGGKEGEMKVQVNPRQW